MAGPSLSAHDVAAEVRRRLPGATRMKRLKLVYLSQGFMLGWCGEALFAEEVLAWRDGPVVREVWDAEKYNSVPAATTGIGGREMSVIDAVLEEFGQETGDDLSEMTHTDGGPWCQVTRGVDMDTRPRHIRIPKPLMRDWFSQYSTVKVRNDEAARLARRRAELSETPDPGLTDVISRVLAGERITESRPQ